MNVIINGFNWFDTGWDLICNITSKYSDLLCPKLVLHLGSLYSSLSVCFPLVKIIIKKPLFDYARHLKRDLPLCRFWYKKYKYQFIGDAS